MAANPGRVAHLQTLLEWLTANFPVGKENYINRNDIVEESGISVGYVNKAVLVLVNKGYIKHVRFRAGIDTHTLVKPLTDVTAEILHQWITDYQGEYDRKRKQNILAEQQAQSAPAPQPNQNGYRFVSAYRDKAPTEGGEGVNPSLFNEKATETTKSPTEEPENLTPGQRALREAQALIDEENRLKQEAEEKQKQAEQVAPATVQNAGTLDLFESRLNLAEQRVNVLLGLFNQTAQALSDLGPAETTEEPIAPTTRGLLIRLVNSYAAAERRTEHDTWKYLYGQFALRYDFDVYAKTSGKSEQSYLSIIEKHGQIDNLFHLAKKLFVLPELK
ncbi:hypothetical protein GCM10028807_51950 [Spirosoma daeguense]